MKKLETYEDIINAGKALKEELTSLFGFHVTSGEGTSFDGGFTVKKEEIRFSFPYGRRKDDSTSVSRYRWSNPPRICEVYDTKEEKVLMTKEQFMEVFKNRFGDVEYEEFEWSYTWGVRVPLKATKPVGEIWQVRYFDEPKKVLILRQTERTLIVGDSLNDPYPQKLNFSEVLGKTYFWVYEEAYEQYKKNIENELQRLEEQQKGIARRIAEMKQKQEQFH